MSATPQAALPTFADNLGTVLIVAPIGPYRDMLKRCLRTLGFEIVKAVNTPVEAVHFLEAEGTLPFWIITTPGLGTEVNVLQLLALTLEQEALRHISVSLFFDEADNACVLPAFELGLLSAHPMGKRQATEVDAELRGLMECLRDCQFDTCKAAAVYVRKHVQETKSYVNLLDFEHALLRLDPRSADQLIAVAEAHLLLDQKTEARACLLQARHLDPASGAKIDAFYGKHFGAEATVKPLAKAEIAEMFGVNSCLIVDPDRELRSRLETMLRGIGVARVESVTSGDAAVDAIQKEGAPALIVMEWKLPGRLAGPAFVQRLREKGRCEAPVVVLSAVIEVGHQHLLRELGVSLVAAKPLSPEDFTRRLVGMLRMEMTPSTQRSMLRAVEFDLARGNVTAARRAAVQLLSGRERLPHHARELLEARLCLAEGQLDSAQRTVTRLLKSDPDNIVYQDLLGKVLLHKGEPEAAVLCFKRADAVAPDNIERVCSLAVACGELGELDLAEEHIGNVKSIDPESEHVLEAEVKVGVMSKNFDAAKAAFACLDDANGILAYMNNRGVAFARSGRHDEGIVLYNDTLKIVPDSKPTTQSRLLYNLGLAHVRKGDLPTAEGYLVRADALGSPRIKVKCNRILRRVRRAMAAGTTLTIETVKPRSIDDPANAAANKLDPGEARCHGIYQAPQSLATERLRRTAPRFKNRDTIHRGAANTRKGSYSA